MWSGDSLNVVLWLGGVTIGAVIGAIGAPPGWRSKALTWSALIFGLATIGWIVAPTASPIIQAITPVAVAIATSDAFFMVAVIGVVALMVGGRTPPPQPRLNLAELGIEPGQLPAFAVHPTTKWEPDVTFRQGLGYLGAKSTWRCEYGNAVEWATSTLIGALESNKITAWGREHPDEGELFEISQAFWHQAEVTLDTDYAFSRHKEVGAYNVQLCQKEMEQVWSPKGS